MANGPLANSTDSMLNVLILYTINTGTSHFLRPKASINLFLCRALDWVMRSVQLSKTGVHSFSLLFQNCELGILHLGSSHRLHATYSALTYLTSQGIAFPHTLIGEGLSLWTVKGKSGGPSVCCMHLTHGPVQCMQTQCSPCTQPSNFVRTPSLTSPPQIEFQGFSL